MAFVDVGCPSVVPISFRQRKTAVILAVLRHAVSCRATDELGSRIVCGEQGQMSETTGQKLQIKAWWQDGWLGGFNYRVGIFEFASLSRVKRKNLPITVELSYLFAGGCHPFANEQDAYQFLKERVDGWFKRLDPRIEILHPEAAPSLPVEDSQKLSEALLGNREEHNEVKKTERRRCSNPRLDKECDCKDQGMCARFG